MKTRRQVGVWLLAVLATTLSAQAQDDRPIVVSPAQEVAWGEGARAAFLAAHPLSDDRDLAARVEEIGRRVARFSDRPELSYRFLVVQGEEPQASSIPGGTVCVTEALVRRFASDDELAFSIGHELAHLTLRHHVAQLRMQNALRSGKKGEEAILLAVESRFERHQELEADRYGGLYAVRAGFRYSASHEALARLIGERSGPAEDAAHPDYEIRIEFLKKFREELERALEAFRRGTESLETGWPEEAVPLLELFVWEFPHNAEGRVNLGTAHLASVHATAGSPLGLAEALPILQDSGIVLRGLSDPAALESARLHFEHALRARPGSPLALTGLALAYLRSDEPQRARDYLEQALASDPNSPTVLLNLGNTELVAGEAASAIGRYRQALEVRPGWPEATNNLAVALERAAQPAEALALWATLESNERFGEKAKRRVEDLRAPQDSALYSDEEISAKYRAVTPKESDFKFSAPVPWGPNVARKATIRHLLPADAGPEAVKAIDGQPATTCTVRDERATATLVLDLGESRRFDRLVVFNRQTNQRGTGGGNNAVKRIALSAAMSESPDEFRIIGEYDLEGPVPICFKRKAGGQVCAFIDRAEPNVVELPATNARYVKVELKEAFWAAEALAEWKTSVAVSEVMLFDSQDGR